MPRSFGWTVLCAWLAFGCGAETVVPLLGSARAPGSRLGVVEVVARSTAVRDPLPVSGSGVAYGELGPALGNAVRAAVAPWAERAKQGMPGGFQLLVETTDAEAEYAHGRLTVTLVVRATLRGQSGNVYLGQTQTHCRSAALVEPRQGTGVVGMCLAQVGESLAGWLDGVDLGAGGTGR